jgi:hypothetical protein
MNQETKETKKETVEEAAENYSQKYSQKCGRKYGFMDGAEWQQKQDKNMKELLLKLEKIQTRQTKLMSEMAKEECDDMHSVLRARDISSAILELEIKIKTLKEIILL